VPGRRVDEALGLVEERLAADAVGRERLGARLLRRQEALERELGEGGAQVLRAQVERRQLERGHLVLLDDHVVLLRMLRRDVDSPSRRRRGGRDGRGRLAEGVEEVLQPINLHVDTSRRVSEAAREGAVR